MSRLGARKRNRVGVDVCMARLGGRCRRLPGQGTDRSAEAAAALAHERSRCPGHAPSIRLDTYVDINEDHFSEISTLTSAIAAVARMNHGRYQGRRGRMGS
jgi:hypothetical protein